MTAPQQQLCYNKPYGYKIVDTTERFYGSTQMCQNGKCAPCDCEIDCSNGADGTLFGDCKHGRFFWQCISVHAEHCF